MATGAGGVLDPRGVLRGRCDAPGCSCRQYAFSDSGKCTQCFHPPAKHLKIGPNSGGGQFHSLPRQHAHRQGHYDVPHSVGYAAHSAPAPNPGSFLNNCPVCTRKVHYDPELGPFDYCSPECRNKHLLPREREKLRREINANRETMDTTTDIQTSFPAQPTPPSPSTNRAGNTCFKSGSSPPRQYTPPSITTDDNPSSKAATTSATTSGGKVVSVGTTLDGKNRVLVTIEKTPGEPLGIITAQLPGETGYRIVGVQMKSPAYHALKEGQLRFLDVITQLNEDDIQSKEWLEHTTKSKTRPMLTIQRNNSTPSGIKNLLNKVEKFYYSVTHIRMAINPAHIAAVDFGITPLKNTTGMGELTGFFLGISDEEGYTAQMSGITIRDQVILYATMNSRTITEGRMPTYEPGFKDDIKKAKEDGKHLIFALKNNPIVRS